MPLLVNKLIFTLVPRMSPWIIRPLLRYVFNSLIDMLATPRLKIQAKLVSLHLEMDRTMRGTYSLVSPHR